LGLTTIFCGLRFETSLFVASYNSLGHGGGFQPCLDTGMNAVLRERERERERLYDWWITTNQFVVASGPLRLMTRDFFFPTELLQ
jgi:hypothetical protein